MLLTTCPIFFESTAPMEIMQGHSLLREMRRFEWSSAAWRASALCLPAVALSLLIGIAMGYPKAAMVAAGGAQCVGFGSFQRPLGFRSGPMVLATAGIALSAAVGEVAANHHVALMLLAMLWAFTYGISGAISSPASWVGQQCCIFLVVSSAVPGTLGQAGMRGLGVLAGGALQTLIVSLCWKFTPPAECALADPALHPPGWQCRAVLDNLTFQSGIFRYALRLTVTAGIAMVTYHALGFLNAYWVPMTSVIIMKPDRLLTHVRALNRLVGTMIGGILCTGLAVIIHPTPLSLTFAVLAFLYISYVFQDVNYGLFAVFLTGYIVFLLAIARMPEGLTVYHRVVATAIGGGLAMLAYAIHLRSEELRRFAELLTWQRAHDTPVHLPEGKS